MRSSWKRLAGAALGVAPVLLVLLVPLPERWHGGWRNTLLDLGHVPLFGGLTLYLCWVLRPARLWPALIALVVAAFAELVQDRFGRTGDLLDFIRGALGVLAAVVVARAWRGPRTPGRLALHALAALAVLAWPVAEAAPRLLDAWEGYRSFPTLADFTTARQALRWECRQAVLTRAADPDRPGRWAGCLELLPGPEAYPGAVLVPVVVDWVGYERLCCAFTVEGEPLVVVVSVRGGPDAEGRTSHYQFEREYKAGRHVVEVDLAGAARRARPGPLDLSHLRYVQLFIYRPEQARTLYLHEVWLE
jgi:hypothetical protein